MYICACVSGVVRGWCVDGAGVVRGFVWVGGRCVCVCIDDNNNNNNNNNKTTITTVEFYLTTIVLSGVWCRSGVDTA